MKKHLDSSQKRKPGAQPGNVNAVKHGRYTNLVPIDEPKQSPDNLTTSLEEEISMLRKATRHVFRLAEQSGDIDQAIKFLGALGLASIRTSRLLKSQKELGDGDQAMQLLLEAIQAVLEEWGWR